MSPFPIDGRRWLKSEEIKELQVQITKFETEIQRLEEAYPTSSSMTAFKAEPRLVEYQIADLVSIIEMRELLEKKDIRYPYDIQDQFAREDGAFTRIITRLQNLKLSIRKLKLRLEIQEVDEVLKAEESRILHLELELVNVRGQLENSQATKEEIIQATKEKEELQSRISALVLENAAINKRLNILLRQQTNLEAKVKTISDEKASLESELGLEKLRIKSKDEFLQQLQVDRTALDQELASLKAEKVQLETARSKDRAEENAEIQTLVSQLESRKKFINQVQKNRESLQDDIAKLKKGNEELAQQAQSFKQKFDTEKEESLRLRTLQMRKDRDREQVNVGDARSRQVESLKPELENEKAKNLRLKTDCKRLDDRQQHVLKDKESLEAEKGGLEMELAALRSKWEEVAKTMNSVVSKWDSQNTEERNREPPKITPRRKSILDADSAYGYQRQRETPTPSRRLALPMPGSGRSIQLDGDEGEDEDDLEIPERPNIQLKEKGTDHSASSEYTVVKEVNLST
jgi:chromosome segregation ATPase